jgi:hypothetical protein
MPRRRNITVLCLSLSLLGYHNILSGSYTMEWHHTANIASDFLHDTFGPRVISHTHTAHHRLGEIGHRTDWTLQINLCDFSFGLTLTEWQFLSSAIKVRALNVGMCGERTEDVYPWAITNIVVRVCKVAGQNTLYIKHVSHKSLISMTHSLCSEANMYYCMNINDFT